METNPGEGAGACSCQNYEFKPFFGNSPTRIGKKPLYQYAANPADFVDAKTIFTCPASDALAPQFHPLDRVVFNYGMNYKGNTGLPSNEVFTAKMVLHPSAFVVLSDGRTHFSETPF